MKLKFRAEAKDWVIFGIFCVFLLYIVALAVLNLSSMASEGTLAGLNPLPAFSSDYIKSTIVFYLIALAGLFASCSSYFFEFDQGFGISTEKKDKGYSRWAKDKEMKKNLKMVDPKAYTSDAAGVPLISNGKELWVDDGEFHTLVIGATGSGKTQSTVLPTVKVLAKKGESMIITDPKGEIYEKSGMELKERGYNIILLNFRNPQNGNAWNPLTLPYQLYKQGNQDKAIELLDDLALNILYDESNKNADPFWEKTSADYFSGLALGLFEDADESKININSISLTTTVGEEKFGGTKYVNEYFQGKDPNGAAYINASSTILSPNETRGSIISVFKQKIKLFASRENLSEMLSYSDFTLEEIGEKKTAVFIIIQDEKKTLHPLATIFIKQCYETLIDVAQKHGGALPIRTNFILDEFANMPPLKDVTTMITAARSRQIRFTMIIQNFAQLNQVYGKENAETIKGNCGNIIYLISTELAALEEISKLCGEVKSKKDDKTASTPLVTVSDLQRMKQFDQIVLRMRSQPFKTHFVPDFQIDWGKTYGQIGYPTREKRPVEVFDIREFVKERKKQKLFEMMNSNDEKPSALPGNNTSSAPDPFKQSLGNDPFRKSVLNNAPKKNDDDFDVDALVRKIDAKIAQLEAEEKAEKEKKNPMTSTNTEPRPTLLNSTFENAKSQVQKNESIKPVQEGKPTLLGSTFNNAKPKNESPAVNPEEKPTILGSTFNNVNTNSKPIEEKKPVDVDAVLNKLDEQIYENKQPTPVENTEKPTILGSTFNNVKPKEIKEEQKVDIDTLLNKVNAKLQEAEDKTEPKKEIPAVKPSSIYEGKVEPSDIRIDYSSRDEDTQDTFKETTTPKKVETNKQDHELLDEINTILNHKTESTDNADMVIEPKIFEDAVDTNQQTVYNANNAANDLNHNPVTNTYTKETAVSKNEPINKPIEQQPNSSVMINNDIIIDKDSTEDDDNFFDDFFDDDDWS